MKKDEAISILATSLRPREPKDRARYDEAVKMAIKALNCSEIPNNSDTISRQQAIDALKEKVFRNLTDEFYGAMQVLDELPSAQPDVIRCKDCVNYIDHRCVVADHHVAPFSCCQSVFGAKKKGEKE